MAVSVDLKTCLVPDPVIRDRPLNFHERTGHILPEENNLLQYYVRDTEMFAAENKLVINKQKTKLISFTKSRKWDFPPEVTFSDGTLIEYLPEIKLLGVVVSQDLRWQKNTIFICDKARGKLWILRRMLKFNLDIFQLFDIYTKEIRSILEMAVPVWHSGLTCQQSQDIERIQKLAMKIILGDNYINYQLACNTFATLTLELRREKLCFKFSSKNLKSENNFFTKLGQGVNTRQKSALVKEYKCHTARFQKSSLPYLAKLLNKNTKT